MPIKTDLGLLAPEFQDKACGLLGRLREDPTWVSFGYRPVVVETRRDLTTQMAYYSRGRMTIQDTKAMFEAAGLWRLSDAEARIPVTWTLKSRHISGHAMDIAPSKDGFTPAWNAPEAVWQRIGHHCRELGLEWGGEWSTTPDRPHVQMKEG